MPQIELVDAGVPARLRAFVCGVVDSGGDGETMLRELQGTGRG